MKKLFALLFIVVSLQLLARPDINWSSPPTTLSSLGVDASNPLVVVDTSGNTIAAWIESGLLKSSTLPFGGSWSAAATISGSTASSATLAVDGSGNATTAWVENGVIKMASLPSGGSWGAATTVSSSGASSPSLSVDATGNIALVWIRNGFTETSTQLLGGSLSLVQMLSSNGTETSPYVYIGSGGKVVAVWGSIASGNDVVYYSTKTLSGGTWSTSATIIPGTGALHHKFPKVVVDQNGNATANWFRYNLSNSNYTNVQLISASLASGSASWGTFTALSGLGMRNPSSLYNRVKIDSNGNIIALWTNSYDGDTFAVESAILPTGGSWATGGLLSSQNLYSFEADVSVTSAGNAVSTYMFYDGMSSLIQSSETDIAGTTLNFWSVPTNLSTGSENSFTRVFTALSGTTVYGGAVWLGNNGSNNVLQAVTGSRTAILPPTSLSVTQNSTSFGAFTDYYNTINWTDSASPNISQYLLYRNGVYFFTVPFGTTQFIDHNAVQNGSVTYGVVAEDISFSLSSMATISFP